MENHLDLVRTGLTIQHHFGWQDYNDLSTKTTPVTLANGGEWYKLTNDGLGEYTNKSHKIYDHGDIWNTSTNAFDFTSLKVGDVVQLRLSAYVTTHNSNIGLSGKLAMAIGSDLEYELNFFQGLVKTPGKHLMSVPYILHIGNEQTRAYPAEIHSMADASGVEIEVDGWAVYTQSRT